MMTPCPHEQDAAKCIETRRYRFRAARPDLRPWERNPCESCKIGRDRVEGGVDPNENDYHNEKHEVDSHTARPGIRAWRELGRREKETSPRQTPEGGDVEKANPKERVLARILREKVCNRGRLTCFCGVTAQELDVAAKALESEGKIKVWPNGRSCFFTPPDASDPRPAKNGKKAAPAAAPRASSGPQPAATPPINTRAKSQKLKSAEGRTSPAGEIPAHRSLFEVDLRFIGILQERAGRLMGAIASESPIDGELLDLFCLTTDWLRERRATA